MDVDSFLKSPVVIDNGSGYIKAGFSGDEKKPLKLPTLVGRPKYEVVIPSKKNQSDIYVGEDIEGEEGEKRGIYKLRHPMSHGIIEHWEDMEVLWKHVYQLLNVPTNQCPVLLTEPNMNPMSDRKKMMGVFFEKFQVPAVSVAIQGVLSLFATGKSTGVVLDSGDGVTHVIPVYEGYSIGSACERINFGGRDVTYHLQNLLRKSGVNLQTSAQFEVVRKIKETCCKLNFVGKQDKSDKYTLPDGQVIEITASEKEAAEILFAPEKIGLEFPSISQLLFNSLNKVDLSFRKTFYNEVILSGGNTMIKGFPDKIIRELRNKVNKEVQTRVLAPTSRDTVCWEGGSILASLPLFKNMWITKAEFEESGDQIIHKRGF